MTLIYGDVCSSYKLLFSPRHLHDFYTYFCMCYTHSIHTHTHKNNRTAVLKSGKYHLSKWFVLRLRILRIWVWKKNEMKCEIHQHRRLTTLHTHTHTYTHCENCAYDCIWYVLAELMMMMFSARERESCFRHIIIYCVCNTHTHARARTRERQSKMKQKKGAPLASFDEHIYTFTHWKHNKITIYYLTKTFWEWEQQQQNWNKKKGKIHI